MYQMQFGFNLGTKSIWNLLGGKWWYSLWSVVAPFKFQIRNLNCVRIRKKIISLRWLDRNIFLFPLSLATKVEWIQEIQPQKKGIFMPIFLPTPKWHQSAQLHCKGRSQKIYSLYSSNANSILFSYQATSILSFLVKKIVSHIETAKPGTSPHA